MKKSYGQHFLHDKNIIEKIVNAVDFGLGPSMNSGSSTEIVVEVGPGAGALTRVLLPSIYGGIEGGAQGTKKLILIEADRDLIPKLEAEFASAQIVYADAAQVNYDDLVGDKPWVFVSNLPYNAGNAILEQVLKSKNPPRQLVVMVQKEVGDRMMAKPGEMSLLSVAIQLYVDVKRVCLVKPGAFTPPPKVDSVVLEMRPRAGQVGQSVFTPWAIASLGQGKEERVIAFARIPFSHRRKQLRATLSQAGVSTLEKIDAALVNLGYAITVRPQEVAVEDWVKLFSMLER